MVVVCGAAETLQDVLDPLYTAPLNWRTFDSLGVVMMPGSSNGSGETPNASIARSSMVPSACQIGAGVHPGGGVPSAGGRIAAAAPLVPTAAIRSGRSLASRAPNAAPFENPLANTRLLSRP